MATTYWMQMNAYRRAVGTTVEIPPSPTSLWLWGDEALGPCPVPVRLDRPSRPANPWDPHEARD